VYSAWSTIYPDGVVRPNVSAIVAIQVYGGPADSNSAVHFIPSIVLSSGTDANGHPIIDKVVKCTGARASGPTSVGSFTFVLGTTVASSSHAIIRLDVSKCNCKCGQ